MQKKFRVVLERGGEEGRAVKPFAKVKERLTICKAGPGGEELGVGCSCRKKRGISSML